VTDSRTDPDARQANPYAYLMVRTDLVSLGRGKAYAHSMHAGNLLTWKLAVEPLLAGGAPDPLVVQWHGQGGGFGTTAAIGTREQVDLRTLTAVVEAARALGHQAALVEDSEYPYDVDAEIYPLIAPATHSRPADRTSTGYRCYRREVSVGWVFGDKEPLRVLLARFGLVPND
jgi:hypothetical protein